MAQGRNSCEVFGHKASRLELTTNFNADESETPYTLGKSKTNCNLMESKDKLSTMVKPACGKSTPNSPMQQTMSRFSNALREGDELDQVQDHDFDMMATM